ncbi:Gti1/Pac2 family-domain-containing protein [Xylaria sp. FL1777]|nr:Gti1/Pac2 family-domain-containing protein [Xylaria sp. FL1777]
MASQPPGNNPLAPTFQGFIGSTMDALILFEACLSGTLSHVPRRPHDRERSHLIQSGNVFIYEEHSSGIKRWTDGVPWSPSRILGNFLLYRELDKPFQPGEKKRAMKRSKTEGGVMKTTSTPRPPSISPYQPSALSSPTTITGMENVNGNNELERAYVGSLVDSYQFKENGLIKKTISVQHKGVHHHLVSYYTLEDIKANKLKSVTQAPELANILPRPSLVQSGNFRSPVDDGDLGVIDPSRGFGYPTNMDYVGIPGLPHRSLSIPPPQPFGHSQAWGGAQHYHNPAYGLSQMQPPATSYGQPLIPSYTYDAAYGPSRQPSYSQMVQNRRHSMVPSTNSTTPLGYSPTMMGHGSGLAGHAISTNSFGEMFAPSAANAAAESASTSPSGGFGPPGTIGQSNGGPSLGSSVPHSTSGFNSQLANGYDNSMNRLPMNDFGDPLQDSAGPTFGSTSTSTTPTNLPMSLDHSELSAAADQEWNRTAPIIPKHEGDW